MISSDFALMQAKRLLTLKLCFGDDRDSLKAEYTSTLLEIASTEDQVKRAVANILATKLERVAIAELREILHATPATETVPYQGACRRCGGVQFVRTTRVSPDTGMAYDAVTFCECHSAKHTADAKAAAAWREEKPYWGGTK